MRFLAWNARTEPTKRNRTKSPIPQDVRNAYTKLITDLVNNYHDLPTPTLIPDSAIAEQLIDDFHDSLVEDRKTQWRDISSFIARWPEQAWRLSVVLHCIIWGAQAHLYPPAESTVKSAIVFAKWFGSEQLRILSTARAQEDTRKLTELSALVRTHYGDQATLRDLWRRNDWDQQEVKRLAAKFPKFLRVVSQASGPKGGRPSEILSVL